MATKTPDAAASGDVAGTEEVSNAEGRHEEALLKTGALQNAIFNSANFSSIATDEKGVIQIFNVGAERIVEQWNRDSHENRNEHTIQIASHRAGQ